MAKLQSFLAHLAEAGISLEGLELGDEQRAELEGLMGVDQSEVDSLQAKLDEMDNRRKQQDATLSRAQERVKELERAAAQASVSDADVSAVYKAEIARVKAELDTAYGAKLDEVLGLLQSQQQEAKALRTKVARDEALRKLADEYPVLKDVTFHSLIPETDDETVLRERAETLTKLQQATEAHAVQQIRDGHIPATAPPRVTPGKPETLERELQRIAHRRDSGEITVIQAGEEMDRVMEAFNRS